VLPVDETKEAGAQHVVGEVLNEFVVGSEEASEHLPPKGKMNDGEKVINRSWSCEASRLGGGGTHL
jgi:hypothetical protein